MKRYTTLISLVGRMFANCPGDLDSIPGRVIPKTLKMVLDTSLLNTHRLRYVSRVKWSNPGKGMAPFPTPWCSSYWKGSLLVALDYYNSTLPKVSKLEPQNQMQFSVLLRTLLSLGGDLTHCREYSHPRPKSDCLYNDIILDIPIYFWLIDETLTATTTQGQRGPESNEKIKG